MSEHLFEVAPAKVMMRCATGTHRLVDNGNRWEALMHIVTWAHYDSMSEAHAVAADLNAGNRRVHAWAEPTEWKPRQQRMRAFR